MLWFWIRSDRHCFDGSGSIPTKSKAKLYFFQKISRYCPKIIKNYITYDAEMRANTAMNKSQWEVGSGSASKRCRSTTLDTGSSKLSLETIKLSPSIGLTPEIRIVISTFANVRYSIVQKGFLPYNNGLVLITSSCRSKSTSGRDFHYKYK